jgi:hypothetical protein
LVNFESFLIKLPTSVHDGFIRLINRNAVGSFILDSHPDKLALLTVNKLSYVAIKRTL